MAGILAYGMRERPQYINSLMAWPIWEMENEDKDRNHGEWAKKSTDDMRECVYDNQIRSSMGKSIACMHHLMI
jgi:hypothetical protein